MAPSLQFLEDMQNTLLHYVDGLKSDALPRLELLLPHISADEAASAVAHAGYDCTATMVSCGRRRDGGGAYVTTVVHVVIAGGRAEDEDTLRMLQMIFDRLSDEVKVDAMYRDRSSRLFTKKRPET